LLPLLTVNQAHFQESDAMERWQPYREAMTLRDAMDRLFQDSWVGPSARQGGQSPMVGVNVDVHETEQGYELCAALPGWKPEDINITVHGDTVTISGQHRSDERREQEQGRQYHLRERRFGSFARSFSFPGPIDTSKAQAKYEHGELILTIPKAEQARPRRIQIAGTHSTAPANQMPTPQPASPREMAGSAGRPGSAGQGGAGTAEIPVEGDSSPKGRSRPRKSGP
jgi:HSP20 family protein